MHPIHLVKMTVAFAVVLALAFFLQKSSVPVSAECQPYRCVDGTVIPACTDDGHVINYFAAPCLTHGGEIETQ